MAVYFKLSSWGPKANYDTVVFESSAHSVISVGDLKAAIMKKKKIEKNSGLIITDAQTQEVYTDDAGLVPKNTSVTVKIVPILNPVYSGPTPKIQPGRSDLTKLKTPELDEDFGPAFWENPSKNSKDSTDTGNEEDKIQAVINQAADIPAGQGKKLPPPGYVCFRCGQQGHFIGDCPTQGDPNFAVRRPITNYGVPKSFLALSANGKTLEFKPNENEFTKLIAVSGKKRNCCTTSKGTNLSSLSKID